MARETIKYLCDFKCGKRSVSKKSEMQAHERMCWNNPANKTCKTCSNEIYEYDGDGVSDWIIRDCKINALSEALDNVHDALKGNNQLHIRPIQHCPYHNSVEDGFTAYYAERLSNEIKEHKGEYFQIDWKKINQPFS